MRAACEHVLAGVTPVLLMRQSFSCKVLVIHWKKKCFFFLNWSLLWDGGILKHCVASSGLVDLGGCHEQLPCSRYRWLPWQGLDKQAPYCLGRGESLLLPSFPALLGRSDVLCSLRVMRDASWKYCLLCMWRLTWVHTYRNLGVDLQQQICCACTIRDVVWEWSCLLLCDLKRRWLPLPYQFV